MNGKILLGLATLTVLFALVFRPEGDSTALLKKPLVTKSAEIAEAKSVCEKSAVHSEVAPAVSPMKESGTDYISLLAAIEAEADADLQNELYDRAIASVSDARLRSTLILLMEDESSAGGELRKRLVRRWAEGDIENAAAWVAEISDGAVYQEAIEQVTVAWAEKDLAAAAEWLLKLPPHEGNQSAVLTFAYEAARTQPLLSLDFAAALPSGRERDDFLVHGVSQWANDDADAAASWAMQVSDATLRQRLLSAVAVARANENGATAATLASNSLDGEDAARAAVSIVQRWVQQSPAATASWVLQFPDGNTRNAAMQNLVTLWAAQSPDDAANWLNELPEGTLRDIGTRAYLQRVVQQN